MNDTGNNRLVLFTIAALFLAMCVTNENPIFQSLCQRTTVKTEQNAMDCNAGYEIIF